MTPAAVVSPEQSCRDQENSVTDPFLITYNIGTGRWFGLDPAADICLGSAPLSNFSSDIL